MVGALQDARTGVWRTGWGFSGFGDLCCGVLRWGLGGWGLVLGWDWFKVKGLEHESCELGLQRERCSSTQESLTINILYLAHMGGPKIRGTIFGFPIKRMIVMTLILGFVARFPIQATIWVM